MNSANQVFLVFSLSVILSGCNFSPSKRQDQMKELRANRYDFKKLNKKNYRGIYFDCPSVFTNSYSDFLYKRDGLSMSSEQIGIFLSVEQFNAAEAEEFLFADEEGISKREAIHEFYMGERLNSLKFADVYIKTDLPKGSKLHGFMQIIHGRRNDMDEDLRYMIATVEKEDKWYVFQFISNHELAAYLLDDFENILKSIR